MKKLILICLLTAATWAQEECTVAVISGKATVDGRPLLWKNRDSDDLDNEVAHFKGPRYDFIGVINAEDTTRVWMGINTAGFAIINSESMDQPGDSADSEGFFMKKAMGLCGRIEDFEALLQQTDPEVRGTRSNFGVIDAYGGAAFFETGNRSHVRVDAADTSVTKLGFLVRANFSMTGKGQEAYGSWRFHRARKLLSTSVAARRIDYRFILRDVARDLVNDEINPYPLPFSGSMDDRPAGWINTHNSINRHRTVSCTVFHGVKVGEDPAVAAMWCILGEPVCGVAIPLWPRCGKTPEALDGKNHSDLNRKIQAREKQIYHEKKLPRFLDTYKLVSGRSAMLPGRNELEDEIFSAADDLITRAREGNVRIDEWIKFQEKMVVKVMRAY